MLTLDRPEVLNALDDRMLDELDDAFTQLDDDPGVRVVVLTGSRSRLLLGAGPGRGHHHWTRSRSRSFYDQQRRISQTLTRPRTMRTPVIAAVNGAASGGGLALALACDLRIAAPDALLSVAFVKIGLSGCDVGVSWLLPRLVGTGHASDMMLTGRRVPAEEAERMGLVNAVVRLSDLREQALAKAQAIAENSPFAVSMTKEGLQLAVEAPSLAAAVAVENRNQALTSRTADYREAVSAFTMRRTPHFTGR